MAEWPTPSVTSAAIVDGTIVDADVSATAGIAASKLAGVETPTGAQAKADGAQTAAEATAAAALAAHDAATGVHGIADTGALIVEGDARLTDARTPTAHTHAPTEVTGTAVVDADPRLSDARTPVAHTHPPSDVTGTAVITTDPRLSDARTPTTHAASHAAGQSDEVTPAAIGAETPAGAQAKADAGQAAAEATAAADATSKANAAQSGAEATAAVALTAHDADTTAVHGIADTSDLILEGDARLTDARTPTTHASSHAAGGADVVTPLSIAALGLADTRASVLGRRWDFDTNPFDTDLGEWTVSGTTPVVSGGVMTPADAAEVNLYRVGEEHTDVEVIGELVTPGTLTAGSSWSWLLRNVDSLNTIMVRLQSASTSSFGLEIYRRTAGSWSLLASASITTPSTGTSYWLLGRAVGNTVTVEWWTTHPSAGGTPSTSLSHRLTGADITNHGAGVPGRFGVRHAGGGTQSVTTLTVRPLFPPVGAFDEQVFTATGGWNAPDFAVAFPELAMTEITMIGPGGGSGGGAVADPGEACSGGGAGSQGAVTKLRLPTRVLGNGGTVTIGAPGTGGAPRTGRGNGNDGTSGTKSKFYPAAATIGAITAYAGNGGQGGRIGANALQGANTPQTTELPVVNAGAGINGAAGNTTNWHAGLLPSPSGGGGGIDAANNWKPGGNSGGMNIAEGSYAAASASEGADSQVPGDTWDIYLTDGVELSQGNSGANAGVAVDGGDAVTPGGYGGGAPGAGSTRTGNTSGAGADGAPSIVIIHTYLIGTR